MLYRALSLFLLLSFPSLYSADVVTFVVHGIKNIVIPAVTAAAAGAGSKSSLSRRSRDAFFVESMVENRGAARGTQSQSHDKYHKVWDESNRNDSPLDYINYISSPEYAAEQMRKQNSQPQKDGNKGMIIEEIKAKNAAKNAGGGNGEKEPEKDPKKQPLKNPDGNPKNDPTKYRRRKASDLPNPNPQPDPRLKGMTSKDLKYPERSKPAQYEHQFRKEKGHFQDLGEKEKAFLDKLFDEGTFLGHDATGAFNFKIECTKTGLQGWMRIRPDGTIIDCGANQVHWGLNEHGLLEKPWDLSGESPTGIKLMVGALLASQSPVEAKSLQQRAAKKQEEGWPVQREMAKVMGEMAEIWEDGLPEEAKEKLRQERLEELAKQQEVSRLIAQREFDHMQEKVRNSRLSKLNPNAMIEIAKPGNIDEVQPTPQPVPFKRNIALCPDCGKVVCSDCGEHYNEKGYAELGAAFPGAQIPGLETYSSTSARIDESNRQANERFKQSLRSMSKDQVDKIRAKAAATRATRNDSSSYSSYEERKAWVADMESRGEIKRSTDGRRVTLTVTNGKSK